MAPQLVCGAALVAMDSFPPRIACTRIPPHAAAVMVPSMHLTVFTCLNCSYVNQRLHREGMLDPVHGPPGTLLHNTYTAFALCTQTIIISLTPERL